MSQGPSVDFGALPRHGGCTRTEAASIYLAPCGVPPAGGAEIPFFEVLIRSAPTATTAVRATRETLLQWARAGGARLCAHVETRIAAMEAPRPPFAGVPMTRPIVMGILNVSPDSFSDGGAYPTVEAAVARGLEMAEEGAAVVDVGGESTRPGAKPVPVAEEIARVVPVVRRLAERGVCVSIDTRRAATMQAALEAGARIVNDVSALAGDPESLAWAARTGTPVVLMHMRGDPETMQNDPRYDSAALDVFDELEQRLDACLQAGAAKENICVDPGIGFGKTLDHNAQILKRLGIYHGLGCPLLVGLSRKSFIARASRGEPPSGRLGGSVAGAALAVGQGAQIVRVHDVAATVQALAVCATIDAAV